MAEITSSSVTSSAVPRKLVSRRSMRMARSLSALPRNALMSCRRSVSLRGRKSMDVLPSENGTTKTGWLARGRQLRQDEVDATVYLGLVRLNLEQLPLAHQVVAHLFILHDQAEPLAGPRQG